MEGRSCSPIFPDPAPERPAEITLSLEPLQGRIRLAREAHHHGTEGLTWPPRGRGCRLGRVIRSAPCGRRFGADGESSSFSALWVSWWAPLSNYVLPRKYAATVRPLSGHPFRLQPAGSHGEQRRAPPDRRGRQTGHRSRPSECEPAFVACPLLPALAVSDNIMSITFSASSPSKQLQEPGPSTQAFLAVQAGELRRQTDGLVRSLQSQISSLNSSITTLDAQIEGQSDARPLPMQRQPQQSDQ